jgi:hypothetical protein
MVKILFRPFDIGKWLTLGFGAWLATLGEGGGSSFSGGNSGNFGGQEGMPSEADFESVIEEASTAVQGFLQEYGQMMLLIGAGVILLALIIGLIIMWVRSRGKFIFLDNVVHNRAEIAKPWKVFAQHGNSLFLWSFVYGLICLVVWLILLATAVFGILVPCFKARGFDPSVVPVIVFSVIMWIIVGIVTGYIGRLLEDFIVPAMYKHDLTATEAWGKFLPVLRSRFWTFVLYGLFYMVLGIASASAVAAFVIITCCIGGCLLGIPYLGAVILLPITVFFRSYSVAYLAQFGAEWDLNPE